MRLHPHVPERQRGLPSWAIRRPIGTVMLTATLLILGLVFVGRLPVDLLPQIEYPQVRVNVNYPGVEPVVLEEIVGKPLEAALAVTENMSRLRSEEHTSELQSPCNLVCRLLLEKKK